MEQCWGASLLGALQAAFPGVIEGLTEFRPMSCPGHSVEQRSDVAEAVWLAANDPSPRLRYPAGPDAVALAQVT